MAYTVYLSDTSSELKDLRQVLVDQIRRWNFDLVWCSDEDKTQPDMAALVRDKLARADFFVSIVTFKRGWEPVNAGGQSLAEIEFDLAQDMKKPTAVLLPKPNSPAGMYLRVRSLEQSLDDRDQQTTFWKRLENSGLVTYFGDEADLSAQVVQILKIWMSSQPSPLAVEIQAEAQAVTLPSDVEAFADKVAEKTAAKVQAIQQRDQEELAQQTLKYNEALRLWPGELVFGRPASGSQFKADVFMIMPFAADFSGIYQSLIKPLMNDLRLTVRRGDEFASSRGSVIEEVWAALNACRFVIADVTGGNDNVFYELGMAHTLNKPAIIITQAARPEEVPFDIRHLRYIQYTYSADGLKKLRADLEATVTRLVTDLQESWEA
jgi:hypothetical protein